MINRPRRTRWWALAGLAAMALVLAVVIAGVAMMFQNLRPPTFNENRAWLELAVGQVKRGELVPDKDGLLDISEVAPDRWPGSQAYAQGSAAKGWVIFFPYWFGKGRNTEGFLYSTNPIGANGVDFKFFLTSMGDFGGVHLEAESTLVNGWHIGANRMD